MWGIWSERPGPLRDQSKNDAGYQDFTWERDLGVARDAGSPWTWTKQKILSLDYLRSFRNAWKLVKLQTLPRNDAFEWWNRTNHLDSFTLPELNIAQRCFYGVIKKLDNWESPKRASNSEIRVQKGHEGPPIRLREADLDKRSRTSNTPRKVFKTVNPRASWPKVRGPPSSDQEDTWGLAF